MKELASRARDGSLAARGGSPASSRVSRHGGRARRWACGGSRREAWVVMIGLAIGAGARCGCALRCSRGDEEVEVAHVLSQTLEKLCCRGGSSIAVEGRCDLGLSESSVGGRTVRLARQSARTRCVRWREGERPLDAGEKVQWGEKMQKILRWR